MLSVAMSIKKMTSNVYYVKISTSNIFKDKHLPADWIKPISNK